MPIIIYPNQNAAQSIGAMPSRPQNTSGAPRSPFPLKRSATFVRDYGAPPQQTFSSMSLPQPTPTQQLPKEIPADIYRFTPGSSLLQTTMIPVQNKSLVYCITTDPQPSGSGAITKIWSFDRDRRILNEAFSIEWSRDGKPIVGMDGFKMPVSEFLVRSKGIKLTSGGHAHTFVSEADSYKWQPQSKMFDSKPMTWKCVSSGASLSPSKPSLFAMYRPAPAGASTSSFGVPSADSLPSLSHTKSRSSFGSSSPHIAVGESPASPSLTRAQKTMSCSTLHIYEAADRRPALRGILVLTCILVLVQKDEWRSIPPQGSYNTPEHVLSRMLNETYNPNWSCTTLPSSPHAY